MDEAVQLIAERAAKGPSKPKGRRGQGQGREGRRGRAQRGRQGQARQSEAKPKGKAKTAGTREAAE